MAVVAQHEHEAIRTRIKAALAAATCAVRPHRWFAHLWAPSRAEWGDAPPGCG